MKKALTTDEIFWIDEYEKLFSSLNPFIKWPGREELIIEYENLSLENSNKFFEKYGARNTISGINRPFERSKAYEMLLYILYLHDDSIYGTGKLILTS